MSERRQEIKLQIERVHQKTLWWLTTSAAIGRVEIEELREMLGLLEYLITPTGVGGQVTSPTPASNPICSEPGCKAGWREGLTNYAYSGFDPVWYCGEHRKKRAHTPFITGDAPDPKQALILAREMAGKWAAHLKRLEAAAATRGESQATAVSVEPSDPLADRPLASIESGWP